MDFGHLVGLHLGERNDPLTVGVVSEVVSASLGAKVRRVTLSLETLRKQRISHPTLDIEMYRVLPAALSLGAYYQDDRRTAVGYFTDVHLYDANFRLAIKATQLGDELYVLSFFKLRDADMKSRLAKAVRKGWTCLKSHD